MGGLFEIRCYCNSILGQTIHRRIFICMCYSRPKAETILWPNLRRDVLRRRRLAGPVFVPWKIGVARTIEYRPHSGEKRPHQRNVRRHTTDVGFDDVPHGHIDIRPGSIVNVESNRIDKLNDSREANAFYYQKSALEIMYRVCRVGERRFTHKPPITKASVVLIFRLVAIFNHQMVGIGRK